MRQQDDRIGRLNSEAESLRNRLDPASSQSAGQSQFGFQRQINDASNTFGEKLQTLESEKISLMKRLNMVLSELEKATHEKSDIAAQLREQERLADDLKRKLEEVSSLKNVVNRNLQDDLKYEKELNQKLREELDRFEREKESLLQKLREEEELGAQIAKETNSINANLLRKTDDLKNLEREHDGNQRRLRDLTEQLEALRMQEVHSRQEKVRQDQQLQDLTQMRNDLIRQMNELSDKYENYVNTMNRERAEITSANKKHVKLLVAKLLFQIMDENVRKKRKHAFQEVHATATQMNNLENKLTKLIKIVCNYSEGRNRHFLRTWYRNALNCVYENYKRNSLIDANVEHRRVARFYNMWRTLYLARRKVFGGKIEASKIIQRLTCGNQDRKLRHYLCRWRDYTERRQAQDDFLMQVCQRRTQRSLRKGFVTWLCFQRRADLAEKYENLSEMVTETWFKQRVFLALKHGIQQSKTESQEIKFQAWKNWCDTSRKNKFFDRKELIVAKTEGLRTERLLKRCYDAIRFYNTQTKFEQTRAVLEEKIPEREDLEFKKEAMLKAAKTKTHYHILRQCYLRHCDVTYRAMQIWKEACNYHSHTMQRMKIRLINEHKRRLHHAFMKWKEGADKKVHAELVRVTEDCINENQNLQNDLTVKKKVKQAQEVRAGNHRTEKLGRIRNMFNRKSMRHFFVKWVGAALKLQNLETGLNKGHKIMQRRRLRNNFNKYKKKVAEIRREHFIEQKKKWFKSLRESTTKKDVWFSWLLYIKQYKLAKRFLLRANNGIERNMQSDAFFHWRKFISSLKQQQFQENIEQLQSRQEETVLHIENVKNQILADENTKQHTISKMKSLGHKIMANFITRATHMDTARGFFTWREVTQAWNSRQRMTRKVLIYWQKVATAKAFRTWIQNSYQKRENELKTELNKKENERRELVRQGNREASEQANEQEELQQALSNQIASKEAFQRNFQKAFDTHVARKENNVYIDKRRNIFLTWRDFIKKEKNAVNIIGAIARRTLRVEVFQRIRLVSRENYLDLRAMRICQKFFFSTKESLLRKALSRWREQSFKCCVVKMEKTEANLQTTITNQTNQMERIIRQKHNRADRVVRTKNLRSANTAFKEMTKILRALRVKHEVLRQNIRFMKCKRATQKWFQRMKVTHYLRARNAKVIEDYRLMIQRRLFASWKDNMRDEKKAMKLMTKAIHRMQYLDRARSFQKWQQYTVSCVEREKESRIQGIRSLTLLLDRLFKRRKELVLHQLRIRAHKRDFKEKFMRRMISHCASYRMRHFFSRWKNNSELEKIAFTVNTEGEVVQKRNEAARNVKAMRDFLVKSGYTPEMIDTYLAEKGEQQKANMQRGVIALFFKESQFNIVPKALNQWKAWVQRRKLVKQRARFVLNCMHNPLHHYFQKWKYDFADNKKKLSTLSKQELIDKIIADENLIGATESKLGGMNNQIDQLEFQRENLLGHLIRGQKLAVALCKNNYLKTMFRAFMRWKLCQQEAQNMSLIEQLERTNQMIADLDAHVGKLEDINHKLLEENEELRQAALDGIEIAKVVQELTRERETLSNDLSDRAGTIKKLIEDNNNLSVRLNIAQREAQQLEQSHQQNYMAPPERDF